MGMITERDRFESVRGEYDHTIFIEDLSVLCWGTALTFTIQDPSPEVTLSARVFLYGPYDNGTMQDDLRSESLIPLSEPYQSMGYTYAGSPGSLQIDNMLLANTGAMAVVDWVVLVLRDGANAGLVIESRPALFVAMDR